jgi:hypothetical protein
MLLFISFSDGFRRGTSPLVQPYPSPPQNAIFISNFNVLRLKLPAWSLSCSFAILFCSFLAFSQGARNSRRSLS